MNQAIDHLLEQVRLYGGEVVPDGADALKVRAPAPLPPQLMVELRQRKGELLALIFPKREIKKTPFHFILRNGEGSGMYLTTAQSLDAAREQLRKMYGDRLLMVTTAGGSAHG